MGLFLRRNACLPLCLVYQIAILAIINISLLLLISNTISIILVFRHHTEMLDNYLISGTKHNLVPYHLNSSQMGVNIFANSLY